MGNPRVRTAKIAFFFVKCIQQCLSHNEIGNWIAIIDVYCSMCHAIVKVNHTQEPEALSKK